MDRAGFSIIEMAVVIGVIAALLAISFPAVAALRTRQSKQVSIASLRTIVAALSAYQGASIAVPPAAAGGSCILRPLWDFNGDGLLDGDPASDPGFAAADREAAVRAGYRGTLLQAGITLPGRMVDGDLRPLDAWGRPLRFRGDRAAGGAGGIGVWSTGPDGEAGGGDDITSWGAIDAH